MSAKVLRPLFKLNQEPALPHALVNRGCHSTPVLCEMHGHRPGGKEQKGIRAGALGARLQVCRAHTRWWHSPWGPQAGLRVSAAHPRRTLSTKPPPPLPPPWPMGTRHQWCSVLEPGGPGAWEPWEVNPETVPLTPGAPSGSGGAGPCSPATAGLPVSGSTGFLRNRLPCVLGSGSGLKNAVPREV